MSITIERCRIAHLHALLGSIREEERAEFAAVGVKPRHGLVALWKKTPEPWAALDDVGHVLAVWGDAGPVLASEGLPWIVTGRRIEEHPLWFFREVRRQIEKMLVSRETLRSGIGEGCAKALRFYRLLGFTIGDAVNGFHEIRISR